MDIYKKYVYKLRALSLEEPYILLLNDDIMPKLKLYVHKLNSITFDESAYHTYYGEIKTIVNSFNTYWTDVMDDAIKEADKCSHSLNFVELTDMAHKTFLMHKARQTDFESEVLSLNTPLEEQAYSQLVQKYNSFMKDLEDLIADLKKLDRQEKVESFATEHFPISLKRKNDIFVFTNNYISYQLSLIVDQIRISIEEIFNRNRNNLRSMQKQSQLCTSDLFISLYEKNKELLQLSRLDTRASVDLAEINRSMDIIKDKIEDSKHTPLQCLQEETRHWENRIREFQQIHRTMKKLTEEEDRVLEQEKLFHSMKCSEIPASKRKCWESTGEKFKDKLKQISELKLNAARALLTFFCDRGSDEVCYSDDIDRRCCTQEPEGHTLPPIAQINIKGTIEPEVVSYLWDSFGHVLPAALCEVAEARFKNPIQALAHKLLVHKYKTTDEQTERTKREADTYRSKVYRERLERASATHKACRSQPTRRLKSDEIDDHEERAAYTAREAHHEFLRTFFNSNNL